MAFNTPQVTNAQGDKVRRIWVHQPISIDYYGIQATIKENGKVVLSKVIGPDPDNAGEMLVDEIEIPAGLIFKLAGLLKDTRRETFQPVDKVTA